MPKSKTQPVEKKRKRAGMWNLLTIVLFLATICLVYYLVTVFRNPRTFLNPFPPEPSATVFYTETPTITPIQQPATWTSSPTIKPTRTRTRAATWTIIQALISQTATFTPTITLTPTDTLIPSITPTAMPVSAELTYHASTEIHPSAGCDWVGVGGTLVDKNGKHLLFQTIQLGGTLDEVVISEMRLSGSALDYGESGFEFELGTTPVASTQTLWIQVFDNTGKALTQKIYFDTFDDCTQNLVKFTFTRTR